MGNKERKRHICFIRKFLCIEDRDETSLPHSKNTAQHNTLHLCCSN